MQAQISPTAGRGDQGGAKLVAEAERRHDVAISRAGTAITAGRRVQGCDMAGASGQRLELEDVVLAELIVEELIGHTDQRLLGVYPGEQQRPWICRSEEDGVDRKHCMDGPYDLGLKRRAA